MKPVFWPGRPTDQRVIASLKVELLQIDLLARFLGRGDRKRALDERLASLEARVEEWR
jgi:hypothetical protein